MINKLFKIRGGNHEGSALLVSLLVMGILLTLTLGLSTLIIREIRQTGDIVAAGKAYFAAEAGIENALFDLSVNLPGYETTYELTDDDYLDYYYEIGNKGDSYPYFPKDEPIFLTPDHAVSKIVLESEYPGRTYNVLPLNESVTIPLFTAQEDGKLKKVEEFLIQYYVNFQPSPDITRIKVIKNGTWQTISLSDFDILRWKIFGNPCNDVGCNSFDSLKTDAISDFYPANDGVSPSSPVCIGTLQYLMDEGGKFGCQAPVAAEIKSSGDISSLHDLTDKGFSFARECYLSEVSNIVVGSYVSENVFRKCNIDTFIDTHNRNYVTLTNMVNPDIIGIDPNVRPQAANIYYRIVAPGDDDLVREFAAIQSDGFAGDRSVKQSIDVNLRMSSFLPVFNFSLYRTDTEVMPTGSPWGNG